MATLKLLHPPSLIIFSSLLVAQAAPAYSQVSGCKDPAANNYNPAATVNDGSCTYNTTFYTPPVKIDPLSSVLTENSGLQMADNFLWSFNDGGNAAAIYRMDTSSNTILQTINLGGATNVDWEDIAFDGTSFYIGDFGNNADGARTDLKIYKFPLSAIPPNFSVNPIVTIPPGQIETINFTYSDQVPVTPSSPNNTKFDCEAMIVDGDTIHLFSKNWVDNTSTHYIINGIAAGSYTATPVETLATGYLVTAADKVPGRNIIALLGYQNSGLGNHFLHLLSDFSGGLYFNGNKRRIDLPDATVMGQAEGITFYNSTYGYISNEKFTRTIGPFTINVDQKLRSFTTNGFVPAYVLPLSLTSFAVSNQAGGHRINWAFAAPVANLQILHSINSTDFTKLHTVTATDGGTFYFQPSALTNCYKLAWQEAGGGVKYSNTICLNSIVKNGLYNIVLHANSQLQFISAGTDVCLFRLVTVDGRVAAQRSQQPISSGSNEIYLGSGLAAGNLVLLQVIGNKGQTSVLLRVQE